VNPFVKCPLKQMFSKAHLTSRPMQTKTSYDSFQTNYLRIYWTTFHQVFTAW